ncbi:uncharacterized protein A4U43_C01F25810 [Asparagus officinalis]|uniref:X8 domain-containing protein n=1 Tax=Asparagus officinalis TaxID=4686 RepID=A0A5P1FVJ3_ASPOF|nr:PLASMODESMATA CALLOSE-BINDING PROTEIN 5-like [Asparagus officinalis]ONK81149.1 uncharacterized protein A4U43_C01F25810 [Asparagus officinalis]
MAPSLPNSLFLFIFLLLILFDFSAAADDSGELWCVAKNNAEDSALQAALDWACGPGGADCGPIQQGGPCYSPEDLQSHASYAFNDYFVKHGFDLSACDFSGTAAPISLNPSHADCKFPSSSSARNGNFSGSSSIGSSTGIGPSGTDFSGGAALQLISWLSTLSFSFSIMIFTAFGHAFG